MSTPKDIPAIVADAMKRKPLPAKVEDLDPATRRQIERMAAEDNTSPQAILDAARAVQEDKIAQADGSGDFNAAAVAQAVRNR